jgi:hypothetical protein
MAAFQTEQFQQVRGTKTLPSAKHSTVPPAEDVGGFRQRLIAQTAKNLPGIFYRETEEHLHARFKFYGDCITKIQNNYQWELDLREIGVSWPLKPSKSPRQDRQHIRDLIEVLSLLREAVSNEMVKPPLKHEAVQKKAKGGLAGQGKSAKACHEEHDLREVTEIMLAAKKRITKTKETVKNVRYCRLRFR